VLYRAAQQVVFQDAVAAVEDAAERQRRLEEQLTSPGGGWHARTVWNVIPDRKLPPTFFNGKQLKAPGRPSSGFGLQGKLMSPQ
jgi:hypothetical protein